MQKELDKLKSPCESSVDLAMLEGPPRRVAYVSSNLRQDYDDVKVTKIMQNVVNLYNQWLILYYPINLAYVTPNNQTQYTQIVWSSQE